MEISARAYLTAGVSLAAATAIAFTPLSIPASHRPMEIPRGTVADVQLTATPADIEAFIANVQAVLTDGSTAVADVVGIPGQTLIGTVGNIVTLIDVVFSGAINATDNPTLAASLTILKTLTYDAYAMLHENLSLINPAITTTTAQVGELVTSALTGSLQNILIAAVNVANNPLSPASYAGLLTAGVASGQLVVGNGLKAIQSIGDGGFDIAGIALKEVTFQFNNAVTRLGDLLTQLGDASGNAVVEAVVGAVRGLAFAPAQAVFNLGSGAAGTVLTAAHAGFDQVLGAASSIVNPTSAIVTSPVPLTSSHTAAATAASRVVETAPLPADTTPTPPADPAPASPHVLEAPATPAVDSPAVSGVPSTSPALATKKASEPSGHVAHEPVAKDAATTSSSEDTSPTTSSHRKSPTTAEAPRVQPAAKAEAKAEAVKAITARTAAPTMATAMTATPAATNELLPDHLGRCLVRPQPSPAWLA
jgi:hypothetical protein